MAGFASSRYLDERRRRRLATGSEDADHASAVSELAASAGGASPAARPLRPSYRHFPLRKALSRRKWKVWSLGLISLLCGTGILIAGIEAAQQAERLGPGFVQIFDLSAARMVSFYATLQLLLTGQLAVFIWWARSRSQSDFAGRYRVWAWTASTCFVFTLLMGVDAHKGIVETMRWAMGVENSTRLAAAWLIPTVICLAICVLRLNHEMRDNRPSAALLWMGVAAWTVIGAQQLGSRLPDVSTLGGQTVVLPACRMFGHWCLFMSLLWHARHVVYKSAEPPAVRPGWIKGLIARLRLRLKQSPSANESGDAVPGRKTASAPRRSRKATPVATVPPVVSQPKHTPSPLKQSASPPEKSNSITRVDPPEDDEAEDAEDGEAVRGLSKKERRRLRKQLRQQHSEG